MLDKGTDNDGIAAWLCWGKRLRGSKEFHNWNEALSNRDVDMDIANWEEVVCKVAPVGATTQKTVHVGHLFCCPSAGRTKNLQNSQNRFVSPICLNERINPKSTLLSNSVGKHTQQGY